MIRFFLFFITSVFFLNQVQAQNSGCPNLDFEQGSFANWTGYTGSCCPINTSIPGLAFGRHTIMSGTGFDPYSQGQIPVVAPGGGNYSVRLGNDNTGSEAEMLKYTVTVTAQTALFIYRYAVVLEDPAHSPADQPRFEIRLYDQAGQNIQCGIYNVVASANIPGFQSNGQVRFKPWTTIGIDLTSYIGQQVTIEFRTGDCALGAHFGYAYIDCYCSPLEIRNAFCPNSPTVTLQAPEGFSSYLWSNGATTPSINVGNPTLGAVYSCTITSVTGCSATLTTNIASTSITAAFSAVTTCQNDAHFADQSVAFNGTPAHWDWDFGDSLSSNDQNPAHIFQSPGTYSISLITMSDMGCKDTATSQVVIFPAPQAMATVQNACEGTPVNFIDESTLAFGNITQWQWQFSDNTMSAASSPDHLFPSPGGYQAQLIVISDLQCRDTLLLSLTVHPTPVIDAGLDSVFCGSAIVNIGNPNNPSLVYQWSPAVGIANSTSSSTTLLIPEPGQNSIDYKYYLLGRDVNTGCISRDSVYMRAKSIPVAVYNPPATQCFKGNTFQFAVEHAFFGTSYQWKFGPDAVPATSANATISGVRFLQPGNYSITLIADHEGCMDSTTAIAKIVEEPVINFSIQKEGCPPLEVDFESTVLPNGPLSYLWNFSDNTTSIEERPKHLFVEPGIYSVSLSVMDPNGCTDNVLRSNIIKVNPKPKARFESEYSIASILNPSFEFFNKSLGGKSYNWDFGDQSYSYDKEGIHTYTDTGSYQVQLVVQNIYGCYDTTFSPVKIEPFFTYYIPNAFSPNGDGVNDCFSGMGLYFQDFRMSIYDRWGKLIYRTSDYSKPWDGKGEFDNVAQNDVYEYKIEVTDMNQKPHSYLGHVSLIR